MSDEKKNTANTNIGEMLTTAREAKNLSIQSAALQCNLDANIIEKLEGNRFSEVGAPVFTRGYLNLYARCLGLDEHAVSDAFNHLKAAPNPTLHLSEANISQSKPFKRNYTTTWFILIPLLLLGGLLLQQLVVSDSWLMTQINRALLSNHPAEQTTPADQDIVLAVGGKQIHPAPAPAPQSSAPAAPAKNDTASAAPATASNSATPATPSTPSSDNSTTITLTSAEPVADTAPAEAPSEKTPPTTASAPAAEPPAPPAPATATGNDIALHFTGESWIQIDDANKKVIRSGHVKKGETITLPASGAPYDFNIGRPEDVTLSIGGENKALKNYLRKGSTRRFKVGL